MIWSKQALLDLKIEHNFVIVAIENSYNLFQLRDTYLVLIRKKTIFYTCLGDI